MEIRTQLVIRIRVLHIAVQIALNLLPGILRYVCMIDRPCATWLRSELLRADAYEIAPIERLIVSSLSPSLANGPPQFT